MSGFATRILLRAWTCRAMTTFVFTTTVQYLQAIDSSKLFSSLSGPSAIKKQACLVFRSNWTQLQQLYTCREDGFYLFPPGHGG